MSFRQSFVTSTLALLYAAALTSAGACSSDGQRGEDDEMEATGGRQSAPPSSGGKSSEATGGSGGTTVTGGTTGTSTGTTVTACPGVEYRPNTDDAGACTGTGDEAEPSQLDLMMLMDRTQSMTYELPDGMRRWDALRAAMGQFVTDPDSQAIRVGVQFFSLTGNLDLAADCDPNAYVAPAIEIGPLSETAQPILDAMDATSAQLGGQTPSAPALQGVIWHAQDWQRTNQPGRQTAVLVITDGLPTMCASSGSTEPSIDDVVAVAEAGANGMGAPSIRTYVIGVAMGANKFNLHRIAAGGGSRTAYLTGDSGESTADLVTALRNITSDPLSCEYDMPKPLSAWEQVNPDLVRVIHTDGAGHQEEVPHAESRGGCSVKNGGWYYDDPTRPSKIVMCPCTCANFSAGSVGIEVGCMPIPATVQ